MLGLITRIVIGSSGYSLGYFLFAAQWDARTVLVGLLGGMAGALLIEAMDVIGRAGLWRRFRGEPAN